MRKAIGLAVIIVFVFGLTGTVLPADDKPVISSLVLEGEAWMQAKAGATRDLSFTFKSDRKPDDVFIQFYGTIGTMTINNVFSSKDKETTAKVIEKDGAYEITVVREIKSPPFPGECDITLWIISAKKDSNKLNLDKRFQFRM
jgi:hypothetical protein